MKTKIVDPSELRALIGRTLTNVRETGRGDGGVVLCFGTEEIEFAWVVDEGVLALTSTVEPGFSPEEFANTESRSGRVELP